MAPRPGLDKVKIIDEAIRLADRVGYENLGWGMVATALGVKPPSLYNHLAGFEELKNEIAVLGARQLWETFVAAAEGLRGTQALKAVGRAYVRYAREHPSLYRASLKAPAADAVELTALAQKILDVLFAAMDPWHLAPSQGVHAIRIVRSALHGFVSIEAAGGFGLPESLDDTLEALLTTLVHGLSHLNDEAQTIDKEELE